MAAATRTGFVPAASVWLPMMASGREARDRAEAVALTLEERTAGASTVRACGADAVLAFAKQPLKMPVDIVAQDRVGDGPAFAGSLAIPLAHNRLRIEQIDRDLHEGWTLHAFARGRECFFNGRANVLDLPDLPEKLHVRRGNGALIDVLQSAASLQQRRCGPSQEHDWGLGELRILQRGYGIGDPRPGRDCRNSRHTRQPRDSIGGEHGRGLGPRVYNADATRLRACENGRDMAAA